jgi:hypothetical protein
MLSLGGGASFAHVAGVIHLNRAMFSQVHSQVQSVDAVNVGALAVATTAEALSYMSEVMKVLPAYSIALDEVKGDSREYKYLGIRIHMFVDKFWDLHVLRKCMFLDWHHRYSLLTFLRAFLYPANRLPSQYS